MQITSEAGKQITITMSVDEAYYVSESLAGNNERWAGAPKTLFEALQWFLSQ